MDFGASTGASQQNIIAARSRPSEYVASMDESPVELVSKCPSADAITSEQALNPKP